jgi:hypothetical protein
MIDASNMWIPFIVLTNSVNKMEPIGGDTIFNAIIIYNGTVIYSPGDVFEARCPTDISKFPFDEQQCTFEFMPWGTSKELLVLSANGDQAGLNYFYPHSDWVLLEYSTEVKELIFGTVFSFNLKTGQSN